MAPITCFSKYMLHLSIVFIWDFLENIFIKVLNNHKMLRSQVPATRYQVPGIKIQVIKRSLVPGTWGTTTVLSDYHDCHDSRLPGVHAHDRIQEIHDSRSRLALARENYPSFRRFCGRFSSHLKRPEVSIQDPE